MTAPGPLAGVNVLNFGTAVVGPWAATLLGFLGANVVKVERPSGETTRLAFPKQKGWATAFVASNINQRLAMLDAKNPEHQKVVERLGVTADILLENYRPGVTDRMGIGYAALAAINPSLIYLSSSGWGDIGPMRDLAAVDPHLQAFSGFAALNGRPGGPPEMIRYTHIDPSGATFLAAIAVLALVGRRRFGAGAHVCTSHLAMAMAMASSRIAECLATGQPVPRLGSATTSTAPNQMFRAQDGRDIAVTCDTDAEWQALCAALARDDLAADPRFANNASRVAHRDTLAGLIGKIIGARPSRWWAIRFEKNRVPFAFALDFEQIRQHAQVAANGYLTTIVPRQTGPMFAGGLPWTFSRTPAFIVGDVPEPGTDTAAIVADGFGRAPASAGTPGRSGLDRMPLDSLKVIDASEGVTGPMIALLLAEAGADVVKLEASRDRARATEPAGALYAALNRNKRASSATLREAAADAAIVISDWSGAEHPDHAAVMAANPKLVWLSLSPFGEAGPMAAMPGRELQVQAITGYTRTLGIYGAEAERVGADIAGCCTAAMGMLGALAALYHAIETGAGQRVAVSQLGTLMSLRTLQWAALSDPDEWLGNSYCTNETDPPRHGYRTKDVNIFLSMMNIRHQDNFIAMMKDLGMYDAARNDERFMSDGKQTVGMGHLARPYQPLWEQHLQRFTAREAIEIVNRHGGMAVEFPELHELVDHPQVRALDLVQAHDGRRYLRAPWRAPWPLPPIKPAEGA
ncbi:MAG: hypothetical protein FJX59_15325 [Alphaproteobacteria bacterium]|nr:hypothetical protein [Alphaproteobacteria bacterium]